MENKVFDDFTVSLEINTMMEKILSDVKIFGTVSVKTVPTNCKFINRKSRPAQIVTNVQSFDDIKLMQIRQFDSGSRNVTGCTTLLDGRMVFTEYEKKRLIIRKVDGKLDFEIPLIGNKSFSLTVMDAITVAVSSGKPGSNEKACIQIIDIRSREVTKTIYTEAWCYGVVFVDDKLVFCGYEPNGIYEIDLKTSQKSVISSTIRLDIWSNITHFNKNKFYVTNGGTQTVTCCDNKGNVIWNYKDDSNMRLPRGISADTYGNVFVTSEHSNNVTMISHDGKRAKQILDTNDGLHLPLAVQYDRSTNRLLVACYQGMAYLFGAQ
ncbi:unnamed protein product [Mytilus coruscus]|uniref:TRIM2_3 n=1 Tax=Mytilus coruscus TaxID=42192 RepID=A0A6J8EBJ8_MYTCO|nr:unnamed protein product [Mytilus coruscus]